MGYMASGKSVIGSLLAKNLGYNFLDLDSFIEEREGKSISNIFNSSGEIYFRKLEAKCLNEVLSTKMNLVLSLGGGTPCYSNNIDLITGNKNVVSFFLKASIVTIVKRLENETTNRPLVSRFNKKDELLEFIGKHLFERNQFYNKADYTIITDNASIEDVIEDIIVKLF